ncbi:MAG: thioredoxin [Bacteroidia bacterium]|jgi:thioredoxin 1
MTFQEMISGDKPVLVDFFATWCGPCRMMAPILEQVKSQVGDSALVIKVDVDQQPRAAAHFRVQGVPTLILFRNGEIKWRQSGVVQATELVRQINLAAQ